MAIYEEYYHCRREPFSLSPDPSFLYNSTTHREALAELRYLVQERKGFATVTGEVGTGKTMLLRSLMESFAPPIETAYLFNPPHSRCALYSAIADELSIDLGSYANPTAVLNRHFLETREKGGTVVLIFDEAQSLEIPLLEEIRLLTNIETPSHKLVQVILAGQPEFETVIDSQELRGLRQRLVFRYSLSPLGPEDVEAYIAARIIAAGGPRSPFSSRACRAVYRYTGGIPRLINALCDNAMLTGYACGRTSIEEDTIEEVAADLKLVNQRSHRDRRVKFFDALVHNTLATRSRRDLIHSLPIWIVVSVMGIAAVAITNHVSAYPGVRLTEWWLNITHWLGSNLSGVMEKTTSLVTNIFVQL